MVDGFMPPLRYFAAGREGLQRRSIWGGMNMGHLVGKDIFRRLGKKIDGLETRSPWNETLHAFLKELYTAANAAVAHSWGSVNAPGHLTKS